MPRPTWRLEAVWCYRVHLLWLKHRKLSLLRSRVGLRLHLCDWGAGIDVVCKLCMHYMYIDNHYCPFCYTPWELCSHWGCGQFFIINTHFICDDCISSAFVRMLWMNLIPILYQYHCMSVLFSLFYTIVWQMNPPHSFMSVLRVAKLLKYHRLHICVDSIQTVLEHHRSFISSTLLNQL